MATRITLNNGHWYTLEESYGDVSRAMADGTVHEFHIGNGERGWNPPDQEQPRILIRGSEIASAESAEDAVNPVAPSLVTNTAFSPSPTEEGSK